MKLRGTTKCAAFGPINLPFVFRFKAATGSDPVTLPRLSLW
ncbi:hypothetical protein ACVIHH_008475 [Bradyrhizobium sp. USDA 4518]